MVIQRCQAFVMCLLRGNQIVTLLLILIVTIFYDSKHWDNIWHCSAFRFSAFSGSCLTYHASKFCNLHHRMQKKIWSTIFLNVWKLFVAVFQFEMKHAIVILNNFNNNFYYVIINRFTIYAWTIGNLTFSSICDTFNEMIFNLVWICNKVSPKKQRMLLIEFHTVFWYIFSIM